MHKKRLANTVYSNLYSVNPTSETTTHLIKKSRARVLAYLNTPQDIYIVIFTPNATDAARLVGEAYPFNRRNKLVLLIDNYNSVNGLREFAHHRYTRTVYIPAQAPKLRIDPAVLKLMLRRRSHGTLFGSGLRHRKGLFTYPAQSNFSGVQHPLL